METRSSREPQLQDVTNTCGLGTVPHQLKSRHPETKPRVVVTASGFHGPAKQELQKLVGKIGAFYSGSLVHSSTTHLVCKRLIDCFATPKYQKALEWGIQIVTYDWLLASDAAGRPVPEDAYRDDRLESLKPSPKPVKRQQQKQQALPVAQHEQAALLQILPAVTAEAAAAAAANTTGRGGSADQWNQVDTTIATAPAQAADGPSPGYTAQPLLLQQQQQQSPQRNSTSHRQEQCLQFKGSPLHDACQQQQQDCLDYELQLSQYSLQQQQQYSRSAADPTMLPPPIHKQQQEQQQAPQQLCSSSLKSTAAPTTDAGEGTDSQLFQFAAFDVELASPSMQSFLPLLRQQFDVHCTLPDTSASLQQQQQLDLVLQDSELQLGGMTDIVPTTADAAADATPKQKLLHAHRSLSRQGSSSSMLDSHGHAERQCDTRSPATAAATAGGGSAASASPAGRASSDSLSPASLVLSPEGLLIPETQADLEDPWGCGSTSPSGSAGTPLSLKYYAMQQCSRARTSLKQECSDDSKAGTAPENTVPGGQPKAAAATAAADDMQGMQRQQDSDNFQSEEGDETTADETESGELEPEPDHQQQQQQTCSSGRPFSAVSSSSSSQLGQPVDPDNNNHYQQQQQQQAQNIGRPSSAVSCSSSSSQPCQRHQPVFRLTSSSKSGSTGLTRLQRRDGYRRQAGRLLVSELSDPAEVELQDTDCELDGELEDSDCELDGSDDELEDEVPDHDNTADKRVVQQLTMTRSYPQQGQGQQRLGFRHSPVHSCSGSSLPAHSNTHSAAAAADGDGGCTSAAAIQDDDEVSVISAAAGAAAATPAASQLTSSDSGIPVLKLSFPVGTSSASVPGSSWSQEQEIHSVSFCGASSDSTATPQRTRDSDEYSTWGSSSNSSLHAPGRSSRPDSGSSSAIGGSNSSSRRLLKLSRRDVATNGATAAAMMDKRQQLKQERRNEKQDFDCTHAHERQATEQQQQQEEKEEEEGEADKCIEAHDEPPFPCPPAGVSGFITKRKNARQCAAASVQQDQAADAAAAVAIKLEPVETAAVGGQQRQQQQQHTPQVRVKHEQADPADALLHMLRNQQVQPQQQQQQQLVTTAKVKQEQLDPAEQLLQNLRQQQRQPRNASDHARAAAGGGANSEAIDEDSQRFGAWPQQQQHYVKPARHSAASSFATEHSTVSTKVPLRIVGGQQLDCSSMGGGASPLERTLQLTLADRAAAAAAAANPAASSVAAGGIMTMKKEDVDWLHTPEEQQNQAAAHHVDDEATDSDEDSAFEITCMPTKALAARNKPMTKHLGAHLAHLSQAGGQAQVIPLKLLGKAPRASTAKAFHGLKPSSKLVYADQVQVPWAHATFSTKERSRCMIVMEQQQVAGSSDAEDDASSNGTGQKQQQQVKVFLAEPVACYRLESGDWWVELLRFYSAKDLRLLAKAADQKLHLPPDFQLSYELLRGMTHEHVPMRQVQGEFKLSKVRKVPASGRSRVTPFFWRYSFDSSTCQVLTDRPVTDFLVQ